MSYRHLLVSLLAKIPGEGDIKTDIPKEKLEKILC